MYIFEFDVIHFTAEQFSGNMIHLYMLGNMFIVFLLVFKTSITRITKVTEFWFFLFFLLEKKQSNTGVKTRQHNDPGKRWIFFYTNN